MLQLLHIENIAVIETADIQFQPGFNVLTGETGAGKSIVIDAIGAILGERTSRDLIRTGAKCARVEMQYLPEAPLPWLEENGFPSEPGESLLLQREIYPDGKNACRLNGRLATVAQLRELGRQLINIHGQHDGQQLLDERYHLTYLDRFGGVEAPLAEFKARYHRLSELRREMDTLRMDEGEKARRMDTLTYQIRELERAELKRGEDEALAQRRDLLRNAGKFIEATQRAHLALSGDDEAEGAASLLVVAQRALGALAGKSKEAEAVLEQLAELASGVQDVAEQVRDLYDSLEFEPSELDEIEGRLDVIYRLKKKYGETVEEMLDYLERCRAELEGIQMSDDTLIRLEKEYAAALAGAKQAALTLSQRRKAAARQMQQRIQEELRQLDMPSVQFEVQFQEKPGETGLDETGMDQIQFLMSANAGEELRPIQKVASGGELARIMLALKNVLAENDAVGTLIFDEVDTGVSGRAAQKVAEKMADVARYKQVLCVTHLPQIAAMALAHFSVEKRERDGRTYTDVALLTRQRRIEELARLTGGAHISQAILQGAEELLAGAEQYRGTR